MNTIDPSVEGIHVEGNGVELLQRVGFGSVLVEAAHVERFAGSGGGAAVQLDSARHLRQFILHGFRRRLQRFALLVDVRLLPLHFQHPQQVDALQQASNHAFHFFQGRGVLIAHCSSQNARSSITQKLFLKILFIMFVETEELFDLHSLLECHANRVSII